MVYIIWEFEVKSSKASVFEEIYGHHGNWVAFFHQSKHYHGTTLLKDPVKPERYLTIDQWDDSVAFEVFKTQHREAYNQLDRQCEALTVAEKKIGVFDMLI